ncbi:hypothetical protein [uncultured Roseovarius sp.]|uniref:hypothetical protein n=1 Tax=uncultured Roseovarius sp. TaxID=293344 RepID=UPI00261BE4DB|nr:hypothetical protein [uncultured Roseovarius sp.]
MSFQNIVNTHRPWPANGDAVFPRRVKSVAGVFSDEVAVKFGNLLTSCWSKNKTGKKRPYYMCFQKGL